VRKPHLNFILNNKQDFVMIGGGVIQGKDKSRNIGKILRQNGGDNLIETLSM
jgi:hypothetical protein